MLKVLKEFLWIIIALIIAFLVQIPIIKEIDYRFIVANTMVIFVSIFYFRMVLDFKKMFFINEKWIKYSLFAFNLFLFIFIVTRIQKILLLFDLFSISPYSKSAKILSIDKESFIISYIQKEYLFFALFSLLIIVVINKKIIGSFWSKNNNNHN